MKKMLHVVCCAALVLSLAALVHAGEWPAKTITIICPMPAGGGIDNLTRSIVVPAMERELGVKVIVKNVSGASGTTGTAEAATVRPDGYTFLATPLAPVLIQPHLRNLPYKPEDFTPVFFIAEAPNYLLVPKSAPYDTFQEFIDHVKAHPDEMAYGSAGPGSIPHMNMVALCKEYDLKMTHIPDRGGSEVQKSMATGTVQAVCDSALFITRFDNKALVIFSDEPQPGYENVPTAKQLGVPLRFSIWNAIWAPKGTPEAVIEKLNKALQVIGKDEKAQQLLKNVGAVSREMSVPEFREFVTVESDKFQRIIEDVGLKAK